MSLGADCGDSIKLADSPNWTFRRAAVRRVRSSSGVISIFIATMFSFVRGIWRGADSRVRSSVDL